MPAAPIVPRADYSGVLCDAPGRPQATDRRHFRDMLPVEIDARTTFLTALKPPEENPQFRHPPDLAHGSAACVAKPLGTDPVCNRHRVCFGAFHDFPPPQCSPIFLRHGRTGDIGPRTRYSVGALPQDGKARGFLLLPNGVQKAWNHRMQPIHHAGDSSARATVSASSQ